MSDSFDLELRKAFKEGAAKELEGWEFTPAMRQRVLDQIRAEEVESGSTPTPVRRLSPARVLRPVAWVAVAAAAVAIAVRVDLSGLMGANQKVGQAPAADMAATSEPKQEAAPPESTEMEIKSFSGEGSARTGEKDRIDAFGLSVQDDSGAAVMTAPQEIPLRLPVALDVRDQSGPGMTTGQPEEETVAALTARRAPVLALTPDGVLAVNADGAEAWSLTLEGVSHESLLAVAPDGRAAVSAGSSVHLLAADGTVEGAVTVPEPVVAVALSREGRLAVAYDLTVEVYAPDREVAFAVRDIRAESLAFAPDGALAALGEDGQKRTLRLYDASGAAVMEAAPEGSGAGLAFGAGGDLVAAGGEAYTRTGRLAFALPLDARSILTVDGGAYLLARGERMAVLIRAEDGQEVWRAVLDAPGRLTHASVSPDDGRIALMMASAEGGGGLWVLTRSGDLLYQERLTETPVGTGFGGKRLLLLYPDRPPEVRVLP